MDSSSFREVFASMGKRFDELIDLTEGERNLIMSDALHVSVLTAEIERDVCN